MTHVKQQLELINNYFIKLNVAFYSGLFMSLMFYFYYIEITEHYCVWNHSLLPSIDSCGSQSFLALILDKQNNDFNDSIQKSVDNNIIVDNYNEETAIRTWHYIDMPRQEILELNYVVPQQVEHTKIQGVNLLMAC